MHCPIGHTIEEDVHAEKYPDDTIRVHFHCNECEQSYDTILECEDFVEC